MYPVFASSSMTLGIGGVGFRFCLFLAFIWMVRLVVNGVKGEINGKGCNREVITLFGLSSFVGLSSVAHGIWLFREKEKFLKIFGYDPFIFWSSYDRMQIDSSLYGIFLALLGYILACIVFNAEALSQSRLGKLLIRLRYWIAVVATCSSLLAIAYEHVAKPIVNRRSLLAVFEDSLAIDAYHNPEGVMYYETWSTRMVLPPLPPALNELGEIVNVVEEEPVYPEYFGHQFRKEGIDVEPEIAKALLDELNFYRSSNKVGIVEAGFLLRFIGKKSVIDVWFSSWGETNIFVNRISSNVPDVVMFEGEYEHLMDRVHSGVLRYTSEDDMGILFIKAQLNPDVGSINP